MRGVCRSGLAYSESDFQIILIDYPAEAISSYRIVAPKLCLVHMPKFGTAYTRIKLADIFDVL